MIFLHGKNKKKIFFFIYKRANFSSKILELVTLYLKTLVLGSIKNVYTYKKINISQILASSD